MRAHSVTHITQCMRRIHTCMLRGHVWPRRLLLFVFGSHQLFVSFFASQNGGGRRKKIVTGARTGGEPTGAHWDHRAAARDTPGGPGRYTRTGYGMQNMNNVVAFLTVVVDVAVFSCVNKQKKVALVQSLPSSNDDDVELSAPVVLAFTATVPTLWMCSVICWTRPRPSSTTLATPSRTLLTTSRCSSSLLRTSLHNSSGPFHESEGGRR